MTVLFLAVSWPAAAQSEQNEKLQQLLSGFRACVRTNTPTAYAEGLRAMNDAANFFFSKCEPPLSDFDVAKVGALPPGILRRAANEEWAAFLGGVQNR